MPIGKLFSAAEVKYIVEMLDSKQRTLKEVARAIGRDEKSIAQKYRHVKKAMASGAKQYFRKEKSSPKASTAEELKTQITPVEKETTQKSVVTATPTPEVAENHTVTMSPRAMIKELYRLGYRIEDNKLVCYVKTAVNVQDIING